MNKKNLILIVDDQENVRLTIKLALKSENYIFEEATNGVEAVQRCKELKPDVILIDATMPLMNGFEATKNIRAIEEFKYTPILMITLLTEKDDKIKALECGVNDFISKPFNKYELKARCKSYAQFSVDATKRQLAEKALKQQHKYLQNIIDGIDDTIMVIEEDYTIKTMNSVVKKSFLKNDTVDLKNKKCYEVLYNRETPCSGAEYLCPLPHVLKTKESLKVIHKNSHIDKYVELSASPLLDKDNNCIGIIEVGRDITSLIDTQNELSKQKDKLNFQVHHDSLTGLANRTLFEDRLNQAILKAKRHNTKIAIFFMDLNKFKSINDTLGHKAGDIVLKNVSKRIKEIIRQEDTLARIGGDEFTIIMENIIKKEDSLKLAEKVINVLKEPINFQGIDLNISISIGISIFPDDMIEAEALLKYADKAMYKAKATKQNAPVFFNKETL